MEQKKTLWIIAAAGVFLLVVLVAAMFFNSPVLKDNATATITTIEKPAQADVYTIPLNKDSSVSKEFDMEAEFADTLPADQSQTEQQASTINIDIKTTQPQPSLTATSPAGQEALSKSRPSAPAASPKPKPPAAPARTTPAVKRYWVQAASYTSKKSADTARSELDANKIPVEVFTYRNTKNELFYRVRVGPYTTKSEAEYWQSQLSNMEFFKGTKSYVTEVLM